MNDPQTELIEEQHGKIVAFLAENVMRLEAVEIKPGEDPLVVIAGKNGAGKTSVLNAIEMALGGADGIPPKPLRRGEEKGRIVVDLGDIIVKRTFTRGGNTSLVVTNKDGVPQSSPQAILDKLIGRLSFDPLNFANAKAPEQARILAELCGLDTSAIDAERKKLFDERTAVNRRVAQLQNRLTAMPEHAGVKGDPESTAAILEEQERASTQNQENQYVRVDLRELKDRFSQTEARKKEWEAEVERLKADLQRAKDEVESNEKSLEFICQEMLITEAKVKELKDVDLGQFRKRLAEVESLNQKRRENAAKAEQRTNFKAAQAQAEDYDRKTEACDRAKRQKLDSATYPVPGLALDDERNVTWEGLPFSQASTAQQLRVSVAIGLALNKKLPILLIRRGSDLDPDSLALVAKMAAEAHAQVWLETSRNDAPASVIMEDGRATNPVPAPK